MNVVNLIGRITKDVELRNSSSGKPFVAFTLAVNEFFSGKQNTHFISCFAWNKTAENMGKYVKKGAQLAVEGSLNVIKSNNQGGEYNQQTIVQVSRVEFLSSNNSQGSNYTSSNKEQAPQISANHDFDIIDNNQNNNEINDDIDDAILWED